MTRKIFALMIILVILFSSCAYALSDSEYKELLKNKEFAEAEKELNAVWAKLKKELPKNAFELLQADQRQWLGRERDDNAKALIDENGMSKAEAYTSETQNRAEFLPSIADECYLVTNPDGIQGWYVEHAVNSEEEIGTLGIKYTDKKNGKVHVSFEVAYQVNPDSPESYHMGSWKAEGKYEGGNTLTLTDKEYPDCIATLTFDGDKVKVEITDAFYDHAMFGAGITLNGIYVREVQK
ncbi:MAG: DUF1311 domain-containing protein [Synergistaceae bacterium]|nr:DUF1311 domain-containing protein [Synergistaceae bacterium]MBQ3694863.1 DUF1311 domain-containing protein [Synergistaceae bacterium]MBQ9628219.1 DUF1311 domain-containing protein [Synergistaceae bacterium]MBR0250292.1 DUF1311 domain-containing protein [Synergistaceae bacterium]